MNLAGLAATLVRVSLIDEAEHIGLKNAAVIVETEARRVIGTYDYGWTPLAVSTVAHKANGDTPLLETGAMRDSIEYNVSGNEANVGSNSDIAVYQELGTARIPARSFLAGAVVAKMPEVLGAVGDAVYHHLLKR